jgi:hypothetical protein
LPGSFRRFRVLSKSDVSVVVGILVGCWVFPRGGTSNSGFVAFAPRGLLLRRPENSDPICRFQWGVYRIPGLIAWVKDPLSAKRAGV